MNKISSIEIEHLTKYGNGDMEVAIRRRPQNRRNFRGANMRMYGPLTQSSMVRLIKTVFLLEMKGKVLRKVYPEQWGTKHIVIPSVD